MNAASWVEKLPAPDRWRELTLAHGPRIATWVLALALGVQALRRRRRGEPPPDDLDDLDEPD